MEFEVKIDEKVLKVQLLNKKHIKHCYLRLLDDKTIQIKANRYFSLFDAKELIKQKKNWIVKSLYKLSKKQELLDDEFSFLGEIKKLSDFDVTNIDNFYKREIKKYILPIIAEYSQKMQLFPTSIKFRKNKRTWGSCNYKNGLNFNYLLMKYPLYVMEYIVVHELAHIKHNNHSRQFWALVERFCPNYKEVEKSFKSFL